MSAQQRSVEGGAVEIGDRLQRFRARRPDEPGVGDGAVDERDRRRKRLAERDGLRSVRRFVGGAAVQSVAGAVVARNGFDRRDALGDRGIAVALKSQRDDDDGIGRGGQRRPGSRGRERRRGGRPQCDGNIAAEQRALLLAHRLLQQAQRRGRVDVFKALRGGFGFECDRVFFAQCHVGRDHRRRDIAHAGGALPFRHPAHGVEARSGQRGDRPPTRGVARVGPPDARDRVAQRRYDGIEVFGGRLKVVGGKPGRDRDVLGERRFHQVERLLRRGSEGHEGFL